MTIESIAANFKMEGNYISACQNTAGNINITYVISTTKKKYILQGINKNVFKNPKHVMHNIVSITNYLRKKVVLLGGNPDRETLTVIYTKDENVLFQDENGNFWRMYIYIHNTISFNVAQNEYYFGNVGGGLGKFEKLLDKFDASNLYETIPFFHDTEKGFVNFLKDIDNDVCGRVKDVEREIEQILKEKDLFKITTELTKGKKVPIRVTHNDTKINNFLMDKDTGKCVTVIDYDTVMPGLMMNDFGDAIRSGANIVDEDEEDTTKIKLDLNLFQAFTRGYIGETISIITETEIEYLAIYCKIITLELAMRFLNDYINGDKYFNCKNPQHNLIRARGQLTLANDMNNKFGEMVYTVHNVVNSFRKA